MNYLTNFLRWSRSRAKVMAPAPAKYPGSGRLQLRNPALYRPPFKLTCFDLVVQYVATFYSPTLTGTGTDRYRS